LNFYGVRMTKTLTPETVTFPELEASAPESLTFAPWLRVRAFRLRRERGDLLVYSVRGLDEPGVARHYLNHWHEAMFASDVGAPLFVHEADRERTERTYAVRATFSRRHTLDDDFEVVPTPGHTPGATAYLWDSGRHRFLFTGDTIYLEDGEWRGAVLESSDRAAYVRSLELLRELDFDVLVPWAASAGGPYLAATGREDARERIGRLAERIRRGADG
jgi:glyoxylase-like metal-dependent hydrolase (beta-lactamase superfamily II)